MHDQDENSLWPQIWQQLQQATEDRQHGWRNPVLASADEDGFPQARTVILRRVDPSTRRLFIYTDCRSPKAVQLRRDGRAALVFWCARLRWQLRVQTRVSLEVDGALVQGAWERIRTTGAAADYLSLQAPGSPLAEMIAEPASEHALAILVAQVISLDWLELNALGHRRAQVDETRVQWLVP